ncbi:hypothetical protein BJ973_003542 [Actinoplanes tereljensis]|uniref:beta strand repeat-containing protein n=1 Tax=Paractinoplanes tereljensis TaxID=571912 RepID=UPI0019409422|nr:DUF11 domain-containing protein [Actinoplanes tereljensis]
MAAVLLALVLQPLPAAAASVSSSAVGLRLALNLLGGALLNSTVPGTPTTWSSGPTNAPTPPVFVNAPGIVSVGTINTLAGPVTDGGRATADVANLNLLGSGGIDTGAIHTECQMTKADVTGKTTIAGLKLLNVVQPTNVTAQTGVAVGNLASVDIDKRTATYVSGTKKLTYTVSALDVTLLNGFTLANGKVTVAESSCTGNVELGAITVAGANLAPGESGTPTVTVPNLGDVAAINTTITVPLPAAAALYNLGTPTVTGGGTCTTNASAVVCTGVTVPGGGSAQVSLPVTLVASAGANAATWAPTGIKAESVPAPTSSPTVKISAPTGSGTLVTTKAPITTGGTITVGANPLAAGKSSTGYVTVANQGPSDASATITIPIPSPPAGVSVTSAQVGSTPCVIRTNIDIVCSGVPIPAKGTARVDVVTTAAVTSTPNSSWALTGITALMNGTTVTGQGTLLTVGSPDVNLINGVSLRPAVATPGGPQVTSEVRVSNAGQYNATSTTITVPPPPTGYTVGTVTTSGGGSCVSNSGGITCTNVVIPGGGVPVTVSIPVTVGAAVTTDWTTPGNTPVSATSGGTVGTAGGTIVSLSPHFTLSVNATSPVSGTVNPGGTTNLKLDVSNQGPSDATNAQFVVVAPAGTTLGSLTGTGCTALSGSTARCTVNLAGGGATSTINLPLTVSVLANPALPITGGCVSLDNDTSCGGASDSALPSFTLRTPLATRLAAVLVPAVITPGSTGTGQVKLTSVQAETGLGVTVPLAGKPADLTIQAVTGPAGSTCSFDTTAITCTGVALTANTAGTIGVDIKAANTAAALQAWSPTVTVTSGTDQAAKVGLLAGTVTASYTLSGSVQTPADGTVLPGGTTSMQVNVTNGGPSAASPATFTFTAPTGTTLGALPANCSAVLSLVTCSKNLLPSDPAWQSTFPLTIDAGADLDTPIGGGCVNLDGLPGCSSGDATIPAFLLKVPFSAKAAVTADQAAVTPGDQANAVIHIKAAHGPLANMTVTVPTTGLTGGLTVDSATGPGGSSCTVGVNSVVCDHVSIADAATGNVTLVVKAPANATAGTQWTATGVTVAAGTDSVSSNLLLATVGAAQPKLAAAVSLNPTSVLPGGQTSMDVAITNQGPSDAVGTTFSVLAPLGATFASAPGGCSLGLLSTRLNCSVTMAKGAAATHFVAALDVAAIALPGQALTGACVDLDGNGICTSADATVPPLSVGIPAQQRITVAAVPASVTPGTTANARISISSTKAETGLKVTIPLGGKPAGLTVTTGTWPGGGTCSVNGSNLECLSFDLPTPNTPVVITMPVQAAASATAGLWTATGITVDDGTGAGGVATDTAVLALVTPAQFALTANVSVPADFTTTAGTSANVNVTVGNSAGPSDATGAVFTVNAPTGTTFGSLTGTGCVATFTTVATCTVNVSAGGTTGLTLPVQVPANADVFAALTGGCVDLDGQPGCGSADAAIGPIKLAVSIGQQVAVSATPATVTPGAAGGADAKLRITATHGALTGIRVTVPLGGLLSTMHVTAADAGGVACGTVGPTNVVCSNMSIGAGASKDVTLHLTGDPNLPPGTDWTATGIAVDNGGSPYTVDRLLATAGARQFALAPTFGTITTAEPGGTAAVDVTVTNQGPSDAAGATFGFVAPAGTKFDSANTPSGCTTSSPFTRMSCTVAPLAAAAQWGPTSVRLIVDATADPAQPLTGGCFDGDNNGSCTSVALPPDEKLPDIAVDTPFDRQISVQTTPFTPPNPAAQQNGSGQLVITSTQPLTGLHVNIPLAGLPSGAISVTGTATLAPASGSCVLNAGDIDCTGVDLPSNTVTIDVPVQVEANTPPSVVWNPTVAITSSGGATISTSGILARGDVPDYVLGATATPPANGSVLPGGTASIDITITNSGNSATNAPVIVYAPTGTTFGTPTGTTCTVTTSTMLTCTATVANAASLNWTVPVNVPAGATPGGSISGGCLDLDGDGGCDTNIPAFTLGRQLASVLSAGGTSATVKPGDTATATLTLTTTAGATRNGLAVTVDATSAPTGLTVTTATLDGNTTCPVTNQLVQCTGVDFGTGSTRTLTLDLAASPTTTPQATWTPAITVQQGSETAVLYRQLATIDAADTDLVVDVSLPGDGVTLPGGTAWLGVTMTNNGLSALPNAHAEFRAPGGTTFAALDVPASNYCVLLSATLASCTADVGTGSKSFTLGLDVGSTVAGGASISGGCVDVDLDGACGAAPDITLSAFVLAKLFSAQAQLNIETGTVVPGQNGTGYVKIIADRTLAGMTLTIGSADMPGAGLTVTDVKDPAGDGTCTWSGQITCTGLKATTSTDRLVAITVHAASSLAAGVAWTPAAVTLTSSTGGTSQTSGTVIRTGTPTAGLSYTFTPPTGTVEPGDVVPMALKISDAGPSDVSGKVIRLRAPSGTSFGTLDAATAAYCTVVDTARTQLNCTFSVAAGSSLTDLTVPVQVPSNASADTAIDGGCIDFDQDGCDSGDKVIPTLHLSPTLDQAITVSSSDAAIRPGTTGHPVVRLATTRARNGLTVTIPLAGLPTGMTVTAATSTAGTCGVANGNVTCTGFAVSTGTTAAIVLTTTVRDNAVPNAEFRPGVVVAETGGETITRTLRVARVGAADIAVTVTATPPSDGTLKPGDTGSISVTAVNTGTSYASGLSYSFQAPTGTTFLAPTGTTASFCTLASPATRINCTLAVGGSGQTRFTLPLKVSATADPDVAVTGGCVDAGSDGTCDTTIAGFRLVAPLTGRVTVAGTNVSVTPGASGAAVVRVTAVSALASTTVTVPLSTLPTGFRATAATGPAGSSCTLTTSQVQCTAVPLAAGANSAVTITTAVAASVSPGVVWTATGITVAAGTESVTGTAILVTSGSRVASVAFTVAGPTGTVAPGAITSWTVTGVNSGPSYAVNRTATVNAPANATFGTLSGATATACSATTSTQLTCTYSLEAGNTLTWTLPLTVSATAKTGDKVSGGCVSADGNTSCGGSQDVSTGDTPIREPLATHGTVTVAGVVIAPGASGTATISLLATADYDDLVLTVPLDDLPEGFTVNSAALGSDSCTVGSGSIVCTGVALKSGTSRSLKLGVTVSASITTATTWTVDGLTLVPSDDETDVLSASGVLVSTTDIPYSVTVTVGAVSNKTPAPSQTTVLPITVTNAGPGVADPYPVTIMIPDGATHGTLPTGCAEGSTDRIVTCQVSLAVGGSATIKMPLVIDDGLEPGTVVTGGCVDQALSTGKPAFDYTCGGSTDVAIPDFTIGRYDVDLGITYGGAVVPITGSAQPVVKIPYTNDGIVMADNVSFAVEPPTGVYIAKAEILLSTSASSKTKVKTKATAKTKANKVRTTATVEATCTATSGGADNHVTCAAPDAAALSGSELWLTLKLGAGVTDGLNAMKVTVTTTSDDGRSVNNTVDVPLVLTAADSNDDDGNLPTTGADVARLGLLSAILLAFGVVLLTGARSRSGAVAYSGVRRHAMRKHRHARPSVLSRLVRRRP